MTLQNLKDALYQNNLILINKIDKILKDSGNNVTNLTEEEMQSIITEIVQKINE